MYYINTHTNNTHYIKKKKTLKEISFINTANSTKKRELVYNHVLHTTLNSLFILKVFRLHGTLYKIRIPE
jgi:hypothetical protein